MPRLDEIQRLVRGADEKTLKVTYDNETGYQMWEWLTGLVTEHQADSAEFLAGQDKFVLGKAAMSMHEYVYTGSILAGAPSASRCPPRNWKRQRATCNCSYPRSSSLLRTSRRGSCPLRFTTYLSITSPAFRRMEQILAWVY